MPPIKKILCPVDFSDFSHQALNQAGELALHFGAELCVLHITPSVENIYNNLAYSGGISFDVQAYGNGLREAALRELQQIVERENFAKIKVSPLLGEGNPADEIINTTRTEQIDLVVIATHGIGGWRHFIFGSVAEKVIRLSRCPVLVTRAKEVEGN